MPPERALTTLPDAEDNPITREALWYALSTGNPPPVPIGPSDQRPMPEPSVRRQPVAPPDAHRQRLPDGTFELLGQAPFPHGFPPTPVPDEAVDRALVATFGLQRREPDSPFADHRAYASARSCFPVYGLLCGGGATSVVDAYAHARLLLPGTATDGAGPRIVLAGRYTDLPQTYRWFRGSLTQLELGIVLRALTVALHLFGRPGRLALPGPGGVDLLERLGLTPTWAWTLPLVVELDDIPAGRRPLAGVVSVETRPPAADHRRVVDDPALADVVAANRTQASLEAATPLGSGIPATAGSAGRSWAEVLWERNSGRMPRGLYGMTARRRLMPAAMVQDAARWISLLPPTATLRAAAALVTVTAVVQDVDGYNDGVYRLEGAELRLLRTDADAALRLEDQYGYAAGTGVACEIRHASVLWFFSTRPLDAVTRLGGDAWTATQYACGWATHGLSLALAQWGLYSRPVRAFKEVGSRPILGLGEEEMLVLTVISGQPRYRSGILLDIRL